MGTSIIVSTIKIKLKKNNNKDMYEKKCVYGGKEVPGCWL